MHKIRLVVGDWSGDGHEKTDDYNIMSNLDKAQLMAAYKAGVKLLGTDLIKEVCKDYEDYFVPTAVVAKLQDLLKAHNIDLELEDNEEADDSVSLYYDTEGWMRLILGVCKIGNPSLEWSLAEPDDTWDIGGYGLF